MSAERSTRIEMLAAKAKGCDVTVLQYSRSTDRLELWRWPSYGGVRVEPKELRKHRKTHYMLGPNCLCPMKEINMPDFVEAAIYSVSKGPLAGQLVASCAQDKCGYFVFMGHIFNLRPGLPTRSYEPRPPHVQAPPLVTHKSEVRPLKRSYAMIDINIPDLVPRRTAPGPSAPARMNSYRRVTNLLELLDSRVTPGVTEAEFRRLFVRCDCGHIFTRRVFKDHVCTGGKNDPAANEIIDLTEED